MPKILKSITEDSLYGSKVPKYFSTAKGKPRFYSGSTIVLADDGNIYEVSGETSYDGGWSARKYTTDPTVEDKSNIYKMLIGAKYTELESNWLRTKKDLLEAIEAGSLTWKPDPIPEKIRQSKAKNRAEKKARENAIPSSTQMPSNNQNLQPILKNPWIYPAILFVGAFISVAVLSN